MRIVIAGAGGKPKLTGDIAGMGRCPGQFRGGILFAPSTSGNLSRLVLEHAAELPAFGPRRFHKRHPAEARLS